MQRDNLWTPRNFSEAWGPGGHERLNDVAQRLLHGTGYLVNLGLEVDGRYAFGRFQQIKWLNADMKFQRICEDSVIE